MNGHISTLITDPRERSARQLDKQNRVLRWLRINTWSTAEILREVAGLKSRQAASTTLSALARDGLVRVGTLAFEFGRPIQVWGITAHGAAMSAGPGEPIDIRLFEASKIKLATFGHALDLQKLQLRAIRAGWQWHPVVGDYEKSEAKYADAIAIRPNGDKVAIEVERTVKTVKRYSQILAAHLVARKDGKWDLIYYLSPSDAIRDRVQRAYLEIHRVRWHGQNIEITDVHRRPFVFYSYDDDWTS